MYNLTNITILTDSTGAISFYSTLVSASTVFIIVISTFCVYIISKTSEIIFEKKNENLNYTSEIFDYRKKNNEIKKSCDKLIQTDNTIKDAKKYRTYANLITNNNFHIAELNKGIENNKELIESNAKMKEYIIKSSKNVYIYTYPFMFIIVPLFFLSFSSNEVILVASNMFKLPLLVFFCWFVINIIKKCKTFLNHDAYALNQMQED